MGPQSRIGSIMRPMNWYRELCTRNVWGSHRSFDWFRFWLNCWAPAYCQLLSSFLSMVFTLSIVLDTKRNIVHLTIACSSNLVLSCMTGKMEKFCFGLVDTMEKFSLKAPWCNWKFFSMAGWQSRKVSLYGWLVQLKYFRNCPRATIPVFVSPSKFGIDSIPNLKGITGVGRKRWRLVLYSDYENSLHRFVPTPVFLLYYLSQVLGVIIRSHYKGISVIWHLCTSICVISRIGRCGDSCWCCVRSLDAV